MSFEDFQFPEQQFEYLIKRPSDLDPWGEWTPWRGSNHSVPPVDWFRDNWQSIFIKPDDIVCRSSALQDYLELRRNECVEKGIYFLIQNDRIVYVGMSKSSISARLEYHRNNKTFNRVTSHYHIPDLAIHWLETLYIRFIRPQYNDHWGDLPLSCDSLPDKLREQFPEFVSKHYYRNVTTVVPMSLDRFSKA